MHHVIPITAMEIFANFVAKLNVSLSFFDVCLFETLMDFPKRKLCSVICQSFHLDANQRLMFANLSVAIQQFAMPMMV